MSASQVSRFKTRLEDQRLVVLALLRVVWAQLTVVTIDLHDLGVEVALLARWAVRIVFTLVNRVFFLSDLD